MRPEMGAIGIEKSGSAVLGPEEHEVAPEVMDRLYLAGLQLITVADTKPAKRHGHRKTFDFRHAALPYLFVYAVR